MLTFAISDPAICDFIAAGLSTTALRKLACSETGIASKTTASARPETAICRLIHEGSGGPLATGPSWP